MSAPARSPITYGRAWRSARARAFRRSSTRRHALKAREQSVQRRGPLEIPDLSQSAITRADGQRVGGEGAEFLLHVIVGQGVPAVPLRMARLGYDLPAVRRRHLDARARLGRVAPREVRLLHHGQLLDEGP